MTSNNTNTIAVPASKFNINEIVYIRESALNGYLEPQRIQFAFFDPEIRKYWYTFKFKKNTPVTQTVGDNIDLKTKNQIRILEDDLCKYEDALVIKRDFLTRELNKTIQQIDSTTGGPEIDVFGNDKNITDNELTPNSDNFTDFGDQVVDINPNDGLARAFDIKNTGTIDLLLLGNPSVRLVGDDDFKIISLPINTIHAGTTSTFIIAFKPLSVGRKTATVIIQSNDKNESIFAFAIQGLGVS